MLRARGTRIIAPPDECVRINSGKSSAAKRTTLSTSQLNTKWAVYFRIPLQLGGVKWWIPIGIAWNRRGCNRKRRSVTRKPSLQVACRLSVESVLCRAHTHCSNLIRRAGAIYFLVFVDGGALARSKDPLPLNTRENDRNEILLNALFSSVSLMALADFLQRPAYTGFSARLTQRVCLMLCC